VYRTVHQSTQHWFNILVVIIAYVDNKIIIAIVIVVIVITTVGFIFVVIDIIRIKPVNKVFGDFHRCTSLL